MAAICSVAATVIVLGAIRQHYTYESCLDTRQELANIKAEVRAGTIDIDALKKRMEEF
jgi:cell division protein FtsL